MLNFGGLMLDVSATADGKTEECTTGDSNES